MGSDDPTVPVFDAERLVHGHDFRINEFSSRVCISSSVSAAGAIESYVIGKVFLIFIYMY